MPLFQKPPVTPEEIARCRPLDISPEEVLTLDERAWYERVYRGDGVPQLTVRAVVMGTVLGFFLSFTNVYIGLKTGWFLGVALTACILSFAIGGALQRVGLTKSGLTILENNCMQSTASSAGYATGNTVVSAIPAMLMLSVTSDRPGGTQLPWYVLGLWVFFLAALGVTLAIPMKRNMINRERLTFPSGTAAAVTLQGLYSRGAEALVKARVLFATAAFGALVPLLKDLNVKKVVDAAGKASKEPLLPGQSNVFDGLGRALPASWTERMLHAGGKTWNLSDYQIKLDHSAVLVFAGIIVGVRITAWMVVGGLVLATFIAPFAIEATWTNAAGRLVTAATRPATAWKEIGVWYGAPLLVASGLTGFALQWRTIARAFQGLRSGGGEGELTSSGVDPRDVEVPSSWFWGGTLFAGGGVIFVAARWFEVPPHLGALAVVMTFALGLVACRATGESDITPGGALGKIMQLTYGVLIPQSSTANLMTAGITSGSSLAAADLLNDLKSGYLLGANPRRQFLAQALGIVTGTVATVLCWYALVPDATALTGTAGHDPAFAAPGAQQWKAVAEVFKYGLANLHPMARHAIFVGGASGVALALAEAWVPKSWKRFVPSATGLGLGMVLPFFYPLAMFAGAAFADVTRKVAPVWAERFLVPIAAGGIAGESIVGVLVAALNNFILV